MTISVGAAPVMATLVSTALATTAWAAMAASATALMYVPDVNAIFPHTRGGHFVQWSKPTLTSGQCDIPTHEGQPVVKVFARYRTRPEAQ